MKVLIAGDVTATNRVREQVLQKGFGGLLDELRPFTAESDYSILNLETTIENEGEIYTPIQKVGPHISSPEAILDMVKDAGFQCVTLANNHILDYGGQALLHTVEAVEARGLDHVGAGADLVAASQVLVREISGLKLAIVNFCENDFSIAGKAQPGAFPLDIVKNYRQIRQARERADYVVVIVHGGVEHFPLPTIRMKETYRFFIDAGADAVINHHQHCHSGFEIYNGKPIFYGLGNLLFDRKKDYAPLWYIGYMVQLSLEDVVSFEIIPYNQCREGIGVSVLEGTERDLFLNGLSTLNEQISDDSILASKLEDLVILKKRNIFFRLSPYSGKLFAFLGQKRVLPLSPGKKKSLRVLELFSCDSHREISQKVLVDYIKEDIGF